MRHYVLVLALIAPLSVHAYEDCTDANNYLEALLPDPGDGVDVSLPEACVEASHRSLAPVGYYGFCPTADGMPFRDHPRPCVSKKYVGAVHHALIDVADCLGFDPRLAFATFNLESATHLNAVGAATDVGVGQLTKAAIDQVTLNALDKARRAAAASPKPSCAKILPFMTAHDSAKENRCGFMATPENPTRNLVYSILLIQENRKSIDRYWARLQPALPDTVDAERLKQRLTMMAYNAGAAGAVAALKAYTDIMGPRVNERLLNFESKDFYGFPRFLGRAFPVVEGKESSRKRISKYVGYIIQAARRVEGLAAQTCFEPGTFPVLDPGSPVAFDEISQRDAGKRIVQNLLVLHQDRVHSANAASCAAKRAAFRVDFVPRNWRVEDLNPDLRQAYASLCK